jgi:hypothetical protein
VKSICRIRLVRRGALAVAALLTLFAPQALFAQGCALCYTQAAASTQRFIQALRSGILILVIPPMFLSVMFTVMAYRRRNTFHEDLTDEHGISDEEFSRAWRDHPIRP